MRWRFVRPPVVADSSQLITQFVHPGHALGQLLGQLIDGHRQRTNQVLDAVELVLLFAAGLQAIISSGSKALLVLFKQRLQAFQFGAELLRLRRLAHIPDDLFAGRPQKQAAAMELHAFGISVSTQEGSVARGDKGLIVQAEQVLGFVDRCHRGARG